MRLVAFNPNSFPFPLSLTRILSQDPVKNDEIVFFTDRICLRILLDSITETHEELQSDVFFSRIGVEAEQAYAWWSSIYAIYNAATADSIAADVDDPHLLRVQRVAHSHNAGGMSTVKPSGDSLPPNALVLAAPSEQIAAFIEICAATVEVLDDWEYSIRMGDSPDEVLAVAEEFRQLMR